MSDYDRCTIATIGNSLVLARHLLLINLSFEIVLSIELFYCADDNCKRLIDVYSLVSTSIEISIKWNLNALLLSFWLTFTAKLPMQNCTLSQDSKKFKSSSSHAQTNTSRLISLLRMVLLSSIGCITNFF